MLQREIIYARRLRQAHMTFDQIVTALNNKYSAEQIAEALAAFRRKRQKMFETNWAKLMPEESSPTIPPAIKEKRERRLMLLPRTVTALICGDPLPGESALDKMNGRIAY